ncbi:DUF2065 domain-containing protein [Gallaecimonas xiamenensis]|uniref:DUF2065 domain-containing protein n=1 Tax=Gallaecimonas xiamenensis 3-C-1 TaxID=745411 RepID=K2JBA0_9GAMM|nr:DUF2065 family protein [Gallaecimonas xiamenensis]EKE67854.1 hypothetical protein B3C1_17952 [Gallaecimonas xiamenensis 3-C-1]
MSDTFWQLLALWLVLEGLGPALMPQKWQQLMADLSQQKPRVIRQIGLVMLVLGGLLAWLVKH